MPESQNPSSPLERCVFAAVQCVDGTVIVGRRHHDCLKRIAAEGLERLKREDGQGFLTSAGRYVTRREGRRLQDAAGIPSADPDGYRSRDELFSEDLY